jgi:hypothetical protein
MYTYMYSSISDLFCKALNSGVKKLNIKVSNPFNGELLSVFVYNPTESLHNIYPLGCDATLILPDASEMNRTISAELGLKVVDVVLNSGYVHSQKRIF